MLPQIEEFKQCPYKEEGHKYKEWLDVNCYDCYHNNKEINHECDVYFAIKRIERYEKYGY